MDDSWVFMQNDTSELTNEEFCLYYTSKSDEQQVIDIYFWDNYKNKYELSFTFNNNDKEEE